MKHTRAMTDSTNELVKDEIDLGHVYTKPSTYERGTHPNSCFTRTTSVVCTLFEGSHHWGVAVLINSLQRQGFQGIIYIGYRGLLPEWCASAVEDPLEEATHAKSLTVSEHIKAFLIPIETNYHFSNYKALFLLFIHEKLATDSQYLFYFDPDIVLACEWQTLEQWADCGIALCEDVNSPLPQFHPRRVAWRNYYGQHNYNLSFRDTIYVNAGFIGVKRKDVSFLKLWQHFQELMFPAIGGSNYSAIHDEFQPAYTGLLGPFTKTDQDALNAALEAWSNPVSFLGQDAMGFKAGTLIIPHAIGPNKPWHWKPMRQSLNGVPPRSVDYKYWANASVPIQVFSKSRVVSMKILLKFSSFISRFYSRK
jgi:hypothetical protein